MADFINLGFRVDSRQVKQAQRDLDGMGKAAKDTDQSASRLGKTFGGPLKAAIAGIGIAAVTRQVIRSTEAWTRLNNRLGLVTDTAGELEMAQEAILNIADRTRQPLEATATLYQRIARNQEELSLTSEELASVTETISQTLVVSGASAEASQAALVQLGQAFASGTLRGEELNSVLEQAPRLSQAIAQGMGTTVGALRSLAEEGQLTAEAVVQALQDQADAVEEDFDGMAVTIGQATTRVGNNMTELIGRFSEATGAADLLAGGIGLVADAINNLSNAVQGDTIASVTAEIQRVTAALNGDTEFSGTGGRTGAAQSSDSALEARLARLRDRLRELQLEAGNIDAIAARIVTLSESLAELEFTPGRAGRRGAAAQENREIAQIRAEIARLGIALRDAGEELETAEEKAEEADDAFAGLKDIIKDTSRTFSGEFARSTSWTTQSVDDLIESVANLDDELNDYGATALDSQQRIRRSVMGTASSFDDLIDSVAGGTTAAEKSGDTITEVYESAASRIRDEFADLFADILSDGEVSFEALGDSLEGIFSQAIGDIASQGLNDFFNEQFGDNGARNVFAGAGFGQFAGETVTGTQTSGLGSLAGAVAGAFFGPAESVVAPLIGGAAGGLLEGTLFGQENNGNNPGRVRVNTQTGVGQAFGVGNSFDQANVSAAQQAANFANQVASAVGGSIANLDIVIGANESRVGDRRFGAGQTPELIDAIFDTVINQATELDSALKTLITGFEGTSDQALQFAAAIVSIDQATTTDPVGRFAEGVEVANRTAVEAYRAQIDSIETLRQNFDGSAAAAAELNSALIDNQSAATQLAIAVDRISQSVDQGLSGAATDIRRQTFSPGELAQSLREERASAFADLREASSPEEVARLASQIEGLTRQLFGVFDAQGPQARDRAELAATFLERTNEVAQRQLERINDELIATQRQQNAELQALLVDAAEKQQQAANTMLEVAGRFQSLGLNEFTV